ncbi:MAG: molybdopterin-dependent oxidoreductase [Ramlibacter sp.]|nr:molybdopterin-dependent oxidoreductase [Ramlibacter sp.]
MSDTTHHRICPLCEACCGLEITVRDQQVISIRGHDADVFSAGYICPKGVALKDLHEDADRLRTPLIKRNGVFEPASWDEAFAEIGRRLPPVLEGHGRNAVGLVAGNPTAHKIGLMLYLPRLLKALGTRNFYSAATLDQIPRHLVSGLMYGQWMSVPVPDIMRTQWLLVLGANPVASNGSMWTVPDFRGKAKALRARGGKLLVIDPRHTETAALADEHHFIQPGSDVFLLLGMVHTLFAEGLVKAGRIGELLDGMDAVSEAVQPFSPETVATRCGIDAVTIRRLARELATTPSAAVYGRMGTCTQDYGSLNTWLIDLLNILSGHFDEEGGTLFPKAAAFAFNTTGIPGTGRGVTTGRFASRVGGAPEVMGEIPITCLAEEIETPGQGQVRALITVAANPVLSAPNGARLSQALQGLEFMVSMDIYLNETSRHADVILPGPSPLEDMHYDVPFPQLSWRNHARYSAPVFERPAGQPAEWQTLLMLAAIAQGKGVSADVNALDDEHFADELRRLGERGPTLQHATQGMRGPDRLLEMALRTGPYAESHGLSIAAIRAREGGIDLGPLAPRLPELLRTPGGRINIAPACMVQDLARATAALETPRPAMVIIGRRDTRSNNSWMHNLPLLAKGPMRCTALVHPDDARRLGLRDGTMALIRNGNRRIEAQVQVSDEMMPGVVSLPHGWGHDAPGTRMAVAAQRPGANLNALFDEARRDPLSGNAVLNGVEVVVGALQPTA